MKQRFHLFPWIFSGVLLATAPMLPADNQVTPALHEDEKVPLIRDIEADEKERRCDVEMDINLVTYVGDEVAAASLCPHMQV